MQMPSAFDSSPVTIAVVGGDKVGKSTFIRRALEMRSVPSSRATTKKMAMDNSVYTVRLLEIHSKDVESGNQGVIVWPSLAGDQDSTTVHGAVVLHDFTQPAVLSETSRLLGEFVFYLSWSCNASPPTVFPGRRWGDPLLVRQP